MSSRPVPVTRSTRIWGWRSCSDRSAGRTTTSPSISVVARRTWPESLRSAPRARCSPRRTACSISSPAVRMASPAAVSTSPSGVRANSFEPRSRSSAVRRLPTVVLSTPSLRPAAANVPVRASSRKNRRSLQSSISLHSCTKEWQKRTDPFEAAMHPCRHVGGSMIPERSSPRWTLVATSFGLGMALLDVTAVNVAVPAIQASLHTDLRGLSWVIDGYTLAFASLLLLAGGLGDRLGARRVFVTGLSIFTLASALCGAAPDLGTLVLARIVQGVGAAFFMPSSLAILRQAYPDQGERARAIGIWSALTAIAGASGPLFGGLLVAAFGWRSIFLLNVPLGVVAVAMAFRFVRPSQRSAGGGFDLPAQLTAAGSLALLAWALIERPLRGWGSPVIVLAIVASVAGLCAFVFLERRSARPILPLRLFRDRTFSATASAALLYAGAFFGSVLAFSLDSQHVRGDSPAVAGLHIATITASFGFTSVFAGRLAARYGTRGD